MSRFFPYRPWPLGCCPEPTIVPDLHPFTISAIRAEIVVTFRIRGLIPCSSSRKFALSRRQVIILSAIDKKAGTWLKKPFFGFPRTLVGLSINIYLSFQNVKYRGCSHLTSIFRRGGRITFTRALPSDTPRVLVFAANPARPPVVKMVVFGAVFRKSPHLRPAATASQKGHAKFLPVKFSSGVEISFSPPP